MEEMLRDGELVCKINKKLVKEITKIREQEGLLTRKQKEIDALSIELNNRKLKFWDDIALEYNLDRNMSLHYDYASGELRKGLE